MCIRKFHIKLLMIIKVNLPERNIDNCLQSSLCSMFRVLTDKYLFLENRYTPAEIIQQRIVSYINGQTLKITNKSTTLRCFYIIYQILQSFCIDSFIECHNFRIFDQIPFLCLLMQMKNNTYFFFRTSTVLFF